MNDNIAHKFRQVSETYRQTLTSEAAENRNEQHVRRLFEDLKKWMVETNAQMEEMVKGKRDEIRQFYNKYCEEIKEQYATLGEEIANNGPSGDIDAQIEAFNIYCQSNAFEKRLYLFATRFTKTEMEQQIHIEYLPDHDVPPEPDIKPLKQLPRERQTVDHTTTSSTKITRTIPDHETSNIHYVQEDPLHRRTDDLDDSEPLTIRISIIPSTEIDPVPIRTITSHATVKDISIPVLVDKNRVVDLPLGRGGVEYSIDALLIPRSVDERSVLLNIADHDHEDSSTILEKYKHFLRSEARPLPQSSLASDDELNSNLHHLQHFDQVKYSTVMFKRCETEFNCISSSKKRNELLVYNSKLRVLIILQHEHQRHCRQRFYMEWTRNFSPHISDITYSDINDQFLLSTFDTSRIYAFDRDLLTVTDLGQLSKDLSLRRMHCHGESLYCILDNNYLLEYRLELRKPYLTFIRQIKVSNPSNPSVAAAYPLFDVTCDEEQLVVVYGNERDELRLQAIDRRTLQISDDLSLDKPHLIQQNYTRIESTSSNGHFIYLNGFHNRLVSVDLTRPRNGRITSVMQRHTKPTNVGVLRDGRLVILYEQPYFMSVHDNNSRQRNN